MKPRSKWVFFPYITSDYKAAEEWLNRQAVEGWQVEKALSYLNLVKLVCHDGPVARYCVDLCPASDLEPGYLELCREAGWTPVGRMEQMRLFRSQPGECPAPIQTDGVLELERFEKLYQRRALWSGLLSLLFLAAPILMILQGFQSSPYKYANFLLANLQVPQGFIGIFLLLIMLPTLVWHGISNLRYWRGARRAAAAKQTLPVTTQKQARRRGGAVVFTMVLARVGVVLMLVFQLVNLFSTYSAPPWDLPYARTQPVVMAQDLGLPGAHSFIGKSSASPLAQFHSLREFVTVTPKGQEPYNFSLYMERYQAATLGLAGWIAQQLQVSTGAENTTPDFCPVELGFEESWLWVWAPDEYSPLPHAILVLRQGTTTAMLQGAVDWTDPIALDAIWQRLELKPTP